MSWLEVLKLVVASAATLALWYVAIGFADQVRINAKKGTTEALSAWKFPVTAASNLGWVAYAFAAPEVIWPFALGCSAHVLVSLLVMWQTLIFPPRRSLRVGAATVFLTVVSLGLVLVIVFRRDALQTHYEFFKFESVFGSIVMLHAGNVHQFFVTQSRGRTEGISFQEVLATAIDWSVFVPYALMMGVAEFWPIAINTAFGALTSWARLFQFVALTRKDR